MASNDPTQARGLLGRKGNRLPSLKGPRDLTLGGVQKKTFTPNIPVRRDKSKDEANEASSSTDGPDKYKKKDKSRRHDRGERGGRGRGRGGRGRGRGEREVIQSHSIFEQGPTEGLRKGSGSWGGGGGDVDRGASNRATGSIKREKMDTAETKRVLDDILKDDFIVDRGRHSTDPSMMPIKLPVGRDAVKVETKAEIKPKIKTEPDAESISSGSTDVEAKESSPVKAESPTPSVAGSFHPASAAELFTGAGKSERGEFVFIQLPDALPGDPSGRDDDPRAKKTSSQGQGSTDPGTDSEAEIAKRLGLCQMEDFSEGYIGKIQVHKSGRTRLVLGSSALDVELGATPGFLQELVSMRINEAAREGDMAVLGHVTHKLVCVPDFEAMLET